MKIEDEATFLESVIEHMQVRVVHYMLSGQFDKEKLAIIQEFVDWSIEEDRKDLIVPRGKDGKSFMERREETRKREAKAEENREIADDLSHGCH